ncbi:hypothetical protein, partial [Streptosporangium vulgare]|uniref:hypothetical protein n=1 Tax=Streptosporangium vulgare TaxID=46190 RepID=UPI0031E29FE0
MNLEGVLELLEPVVALGRCRLDEREDNALEGLGSAEDLLRWSTASSVSGSGFPACACAMTREPC